MRNTQINPVDAYFLTINSKATIQSSFFRLRAFCLFTFNNSDFDLCNWSDFSYIKVLSFKQHQRELGLAFSSINVTLSILKSVALQAWQLNIVGKGNKERTIYLRPFVQAALKSWLAINDNESGALFVRIFSGGKLGNRLGVLSIHRAIERIQSNTDLERFTTHDLRRTFTTTLLDANADKFAVQRLLGHSSLVTTERYDKRGERAAKAAIELLPY